MHLGSALHVAGAHCWRSCTCLLKVAPAGSVIGSWCFCSDRSIGGSAQHHMRICGKISDWEGRYRHANATYLAMRCKLACPGQPVLHGTHHDKACRVLVISGMPMTVVAAASPHMVACMYAYIGIPQSLCEGWTLQLFRRVFNALWQVLYTWPAAAKVPEKQTQSDVV